MSETQQPARLVPVHYGPEAGGGIRQTPLSLEARSFALSRLQLTSFALLCSLFVLCAST